MQKFFGKYWLLLLFLITVSGYLMGVMHVGSTIWGDSIYYYAYTRSLVMDRDINFTNESIESSLPFPNPPTINAQTNLVVNNFSPGTGLLWIPAFVLGQALTTILAGLDLPVINNGYSLISEISVGLGAVGFGITGVYFFYRGLKLLFPNKIVTHTIISFLLTTQLLYYLSLDPVNSHTASFLFASLSFFIWVQIWQAKKISWNQAMGLGASLGILALIRNQDVLTGIILLSSLIFRVKPLTFVLQRIAMAVLLAMAIVSIQLATTWTIFHSRQSPYMLSGQILHWFKPDFMRVLFTSGNGFFRYAPAALFSLVGLFYYVKKAKYLAITCMLVFFGQLYVIASWAPEIVGGPYGSRMFTATLPFLSVGLAQLLTMLKKHYWIIGVSGLFVWNVYQIGVMLIRW